ncbi:MAG: response regulator transcription factor [Clostridia bacterium]|nr:response regulator transcription factor [Clostridia bacterium]
MFRILIAEDDAALRQMFCRVLSRSGFDPIPVADGQEALEVLEKEFVDLIVSDIMMPRVDGYELVQTLRDSGSSIPVLMITAKDRFQDLQLGFLSGTDDFMVKPVNVNEMVLRINALLRRAQMISDRRQTIGGTVLEFDSFTLRCGTASYILPQKEFQLLYKLTSFPGRIFTRQQLMEDIWGPDSESDAHTVDVHIGRLRERLRDNPDMEIITVRGLGYKVVRKNG